MISANDFANTAREVYDRHKVPYQKRGSSLNGMDSAGFITYCLRKNGVQVSYKGTNDLFRNGCISLTPLKEAIQNKMIVPGAILLHIDYNGNEPAEYKADRKGDCDFSLIAINSTTALYPSQKKKALISTKIEPVNGKANFVALLKNIDYRFQSSCTPNGSTGSTHLPSNCVYTKANLKLRKSASMSGEVIDEIPKGKSVELIQYGPEWCQVKYSVRTGLYHIGWCASQYLTQG